MTKFATVQLVQFSPASSEEEQAQCQLLWCFNSESGNTVFAKGSLEDFKAALDSHKSLPVRLLLAPNMALLSPIEVNQKQKRYIKKALPFLVEDILMNDLQDNTVVPWLVDQSYAAVVETSLLRQIIELFEQSNIALEAIVPIQSLIDDDAAVAHAATHDETEANDVVQLYSKTLGYLQLAAKDLSQKWVSAQYFNRDNLIAVGIPDEYQQSFQSQDPDAQTATSYLDDMQYLVSLSQKLDGAANKLCNFRQGEFAYKKQRSVSISSQWRWPIYAAVLSIMIGSILMVAEGVWYSKQAKVKRAETIQIYKAYFPGERIRSVRRQLREKLNRGSGKAQPAFLEMLDVFSRKLSAGNSKIVIEKINYDQIKDGMRMRLVAQTYDDVSALAKKIEGSGFKLDISRSSQGKGGLEAHVVLTRAEGKGNE